MATNVAKKIGGFLMRTRVQLLLRRIWFSGFSWEELEDYLGLRKSTLIEELKEFFKNIPEATETVFKTINKAEENGRKKRKAANPVIAR